MWSECGDLINRDVIARRNFMILEESRDFPSESEVFIKWDWRDLGNISTDGFFVEQKIIFVPNDIA